MANLFHALFIVLFLAIGRTSISHVPIAALAGVTAYVGICLLEWGTWHRLPKMRTVDALAFLSTGIAVLLTNAVLAVAIGCAFYPIRWAYRQIMLRQLRWRTRGTRPTSVDAPAPRDIGYATRENSRTRVLEDLQIKK